MYRNYWKRTFGNMTKDGPWWRGWDGNLDIEDLDKVGAWDRDFDCNGCAVPRRPHHPQNALELSGIRVPLRPQPAKGHPWFGFVLAAVVGGIITKLPLQQPKGRPYLGYVLAVAVGAVMSKFLTPS